MWSGQIWYMIRFILWMIFLSVILLYQLWIASRIFFGSWIILFWGVGVGGGGRYPSEELGHFRCISLYNTHNCCFLIPVHNNITCREVGLGAGMGRREIYPCDYTCSSDFTSPGSHLDLSRCPLLHQSLQPPVLRTVRVVIQPESSGCWQWAHSTLQLLIQPWTCAPGTHYGWMDRGSVEYKVCPALLHMASTGNQNPRPSDLESNAHPLGRMLQREKGWEVKCAWLPLCGHTNTVLGWKGPFCKH